LVIVGSGFLEQKLCGVSSDNLQVIGRNIIVISEFESGFAGSSRSSSFRGLDQENISWDLASGGCTVIFINQGRKVGRSQWLGSSS